MKCKKHPADFSSGVGVCASCLRERLFAIIAVQAEKEAQEVRRDFDTQPALAFPRSVSPYVACRESDAAATWNLRYSSPQVAPASSITVGIEKKRSGGRFSSLFSGLFRSKTEKPDSDSGPISDPGVARAASTPLWFPTILPVRQKKQIRTLSLDQNVIGGHRRNCRNLDRGMSPARDPDEEHFPGGLSGYSSESSQGWKQTPRRTPGMRRRGGFPGYCRNVSSIAFCLSPLVRASPNLQWNQKGVPPEAVVAGDSRIPAKPYLSSASSFCKNRSRKLCDFGRHNPNH
ncbi:unnamed protein product [Fraxinus pennsylvanica]|uniref:Uncharacterized protein n=1 Tax=Fraxinus pennsylvanica TaxID=56036 RepID=A0AAD2DV40_9LAMI|nr:unnamed protein product [Fraxinus pennsylvanica]